MLLEKIEEVISLLKSPLTSAETADGWTTDAKHAILQLFESLMNDTKDRKDIPYVGLVRTLDAWGIERGGTLYEGAMEVAREINAKSE